jgi:uncharacterized repeat protein (TIGR03803 family)
VRFQSRKQQSCYETILAKKSRRSKPCSTASHHPPIIPGGNEDMKYKTGLLLKALLIVSLVTTARAQIPSQLFAFGCDSQTGVCANGENPNSLIQSADGNFYGTTTTGGIGNAARGTVFKITSAGQLTTLFTFVADPNGNYPNGELPTSLVEGNDGFLYGTTDAGGANNVGVVYKLGKSGLFQVLHNLCSSCGEGSSPSSLILGRDGNFYGTSLGVLFRITPAGSFTVLHTFDSATEGPTGLGLVQATDGNFYGTTEGASTIFTTLFRLTCAGVFTVLHTLRYSDFPASSPIQGVDGKLYGATSGGILVSSLSGADYQELSIPDSFIAHQPIYQPSDSNLWDAIFGDDTAPNGELRVISTNGIVQQTISFNVSNGAFPNAAVLQGSDGKILGVTYGGGTVSQGQTANGVVFTLDAGLVAPLPAIGNFTPNNGTVGTKVTLHGSHFIGTTQVSFNGTSAAFRVLNTGNIRATVPAEATTGPITVTNPGGTRQSQQSFTVH